MNSPALRRRWPRAGWLVETNGVFVGRCVAGTPVEYCAHRSLARVFPRKWQAELVAMRCDNAVLIKVAAFGDCGR